jgi:UDP-N-acetylglucosamine 2-epimerase (non-hydrolysing)
MTAVRDLSDSGEAQVILPLHPNPEVRKAAISVFGDEIPQDLYITAPLDYREFIWLMDKSLFLMSDSGGVQEEAPALGKPVIVTREKTERPEAVLLGANILAGTDPEYILKQAKSLLKDRMLYARMAMPRNIYGDGRAAERICTTLLPEKHFSQEGLVAIH